MDYFVSEVAEADIKKERARARELRNSQWWKRRRSSGACHFCGGKFPPQELTMEHLVPIVRGGKSVKGNVVPACKDCNSRKKYRLPFEFEYPASGGRPEPFFESGATREASTDDGSERTP
jgi:5-methylcytosine-specific restriction endonuclease McrA